MRSLKLYQNMFLFAFVYDLVLGLVFFLFYGQVYSAFSITTPGNPAYLQMSAAFVVVQGWLYYFVYRNMERNIDIVKIGLIYKLVYVGVVFYYWASVGVPHPLFKLFAFFDLVFAVLFVLFLVDYNNLFGKKSK